MTLEERETEVLEALADLDGWWVKPHEVGGTDRSHHARTLALLHQKGIVERRNTGFGFSRPAYEYRWSSE